MPVVFDTVSGLEWLSPTATLRRTVNEVEGGADGWTTQGFRYALAEELIALLGNVGVNTTPDPLYGSITADSVAEVSAVQELIGIWGPTSISNPPTPGNPFGQQNIFGILGDPFLGDGQSPTSRTSVSMFATDTQAVISIGGQWLYRASDAHVGSFLVRSVPVEIPEPPISSLVVASIIAMLLAARRQRARAA